ncbi:hypothetical protein GCM10027425_12540 [Alteromonas gracilis]
MTEKQQTTDQGETIDVDATTTEAQSEEQQPAEKAEDTEEPTSSNEAAKYRRRLRETEAERDSLAQQLETMQRAEVERVAGKHLQRPEALWTAGVELSGCLTAEGTVDAEKVAQAAREAAERLGLARPYDGAFSPAEGQRSTSYARSMEDVVRGN